MYNVDKLPGYAEAWPGLGSPELVDGLDPVRPQSVGAAAVAEVVSQAG